MSSVYEANVGHTDSGGGVRSGDDVFVTIPGLSQLEQERGFSGFDRNRGFGSDGCTEHGDSAAFDALHEVILIGIALSCHVISPGRGARIEII